MIQPTKQAPTPLVAKTTPVLSEIEQRRLKLKKATQAFEAIFIAKLLKNMHSVTLNKEDDGFGKDIMMEMADESVSQQLAKTGKFGIGKIMLKHLTKKLDETPANPHEVKIGKPTYLPPDVTKPVVVPKATESAHATVNKQNSIHVDIVQHAPIAIRHEPIKITVAPEKVESATTTSSPESFPRLRKYLDHIKEAAAESNLPENLIQSMIMHESGGDASAVSSKGATGLMQLMPDTAKSVGVTNPLDPKENILGGARYFRSLLNRFGDLKTALAAYNAGPGNVLKHGGIPPFAETLKYIDRVISDINGTK